MPGILRMENMSKGVDKQAPFHLAPGFPLHLLLRGIHPKYSPP